jgi:hypothetical protein
MIRARMEHLKAKKTLTPAALANGYARPADSSTKDAA